MMRDIPGMILLFLLPLFLVIVVTLTQEKALSKIDNTMISIVIVDEDNNSLGSSIIDGLKESKYFDIVTEYKGQKINKVLSFVILNLSFARQKE